jgi:hypothetical protein
MLTEPSHSPAGRLFFSIKNNPPKVAALITAQRIHPSYCFRNDDFPQVHLCGQNLLDTQNRSSYTRAVKKEVLINYGDQIQT